MEGATTFILTLWALGNIAFTLFARADFKELHRAWEKHKQLTNDHKKIEKIIVVLRKGRVIEHIDAKSYRSWSNGYKVNNSNGDIIAEYPEREVEFIHVVREGEDLA